MTEIRSHRDLNVWKKAMDLAVEIYRISSSFPANEAYRLTGQITRAAVSVPANIAEGYARSSTKAYANYLGIAKGSLMETETFLLLAMRLEFVKKVRAETVCVAIEEISKMLTALRSKIR